MHKLNTVVKATLLLAVFITVNVGAADYSGSIKITDKGKTASVSEYADTVIYFVPDEPVEADLMPSHEKEMIMKGKSFLPRVLSVGVGSTISFPNFDPILHNAFSTSPKNSFDLGLYAGGEQESYTFDKAGLVRVYCNVHHNMVGYILVFDTPYFTSPTEQGNFSLENLPEGSSGKIFIWHPRSKVIKQAVNLNVAAQQEMFEVKLTKRRIPKHKNKKGKSYRKSKEKVY